MFSEELMIKSWILTKKICHNCNDALVMIARRELTYPIVDHVVSKMWRNSRIVIWPVHNSIRKQWRIKTPTRWRTRLAHRMAQMLKISKARLHNQHVSVDIRNGKL